MPTAEVLPDGHPGFTLSGFGNTVRGTMVFQMLPSVYGTFRHAMLKAANSAQQSNFDRSFYIQEY
ncbi:MAG: YjbH domain-containing protein [Marinibacterium sp.]|nr:YjbH domain-containing protein [Marinibacterium sp.]